MSTYDVAKAAILAVCRAYSGGTIFTTANSAADDYSVMDTTSGPYALILTKGGPTKEGDNLDGRGAHGMYQEQHLFKLTISAKVGNAQQGYSAIVAGLEALVEGLKDYLRAHTRLSNGEPISRAQTIETSVINERVPKDANAPTHFLVDVLLRVYCEAEIPEPDEAGY